MIIHAAVRHMAESQILGMVSPEVIARLKQSDPNPEIRAYVVAHEGETRGNLPGIGHRAIRYVQHAIRGIYEKLAVGTKIFHGHGETNGHEGRTVVGELVGKASEVIDGVLHSIAAIYVPPEHRAKRLDVASIEANINFDDLGGGHLDAVKVENVTGIALGDSAVETPGFPGAQLLAAVQAFVGEDNEMTLAELKAEIAKGGHRPSDVFTESDLEGDPGVLGMIRKGKQTEYEHAKRVEGKLEEERKANLEAKKAHDAELGKVRSEALQGKARGTLDGMIGDRKLDDKQKAFVSKVYERFTTEATDEDKLKGDLTKFLDGALEDYSETAKIFGAIAGTGEGGGVNGADGEEGTSSGDTKNLTDPANNDFIPK